MSLHLTPVGRLDKLIYLRCPQCGQTVAEVARDAVGLILTVRVRHKLLGGDIDEAFRWTYTLEGRSGPTPTTAGIFGWRALERVADPRRPFDRRKYENQLDALRTPDGHWPDGVNANGVESDRLHGAWSDGGFHCPRCPCRPRIDRGMIAAGLDAYDRRGSAQKVKLSAE